MKASGAVQRETLPLNMQGVLQEWRAATDYRLTSLEISVGRQHARSLIRIGIGQATRYGIMVAVTALIAGCTPGTHVSNCNAPSAVGSCYMDGDGGGVK